MKKRRKETRPRQRRHSVEEFLAAGLGNLPDTVVGKKLGIGRGCAYHMRKKLGIPYDKKAMRRLVPTRVRDWLAVDWTQTNGAIARSLGLAKRTVASERWKLRREGHRIPRAPSPFIDKPKACRSAASTGKRPSRARALRSARSLR